MTAIKSDAERVHLGTMNERQAGLLLKHRAKIIQLRGLLKEAEGNYQDLIAMCMPEGANTFDDNTFSFFSDASRIPQGPPPEDVEPEDVED